MLSGRAFRAQLVVQGQRELFDYWLLSAGLRRMPARSDLDPFKVPQLLPHIGLIDVRDGVDGAAFKLAGTRLHDIYGQEITGKRAGEVFTGDQADYWHRISCQAGGKGLAAERRCAGTGPGSRPYRLVLVEVTAVRRWRTGRSHPLLRRGGSVDERARSARACAALLSPHSAEALAAAGAIWLSLDPAQASRVLLCKR